jgi:hypothetical protein
MGRVRPEIFDPVLFCSFPHIFCGHLIFVGSRSVVFRESRGREYLVFDFLDLAVRRAP